MVPMKYMIVLIVVLLILFGLTFGLQYVKNKIFIFRNCLKYFDQYLVWLLEWYIFSKANQLLKDVGGATYKTDNMIVVVKKDDPAENLLDAQDYRFGFQTAADQDNNEKMKEDIQSAVGRELKVVEFDTVQDEAQGLLDGKIEAAVYNEAFAGIIEETIEDYADQVRVLYQYGIDTPIEQEETNIEEPFNVYISGIDVSGPITTQQPERREYHYDGKS